jgi:glycosyltransferase involved in cell wall biosynthesis
MELIKHFSISEDRIKVIHNGFHPYHPVRKKYKKQVQDFIIKNKLPKDYLVYIGVLDPRKNLGNLIKTLFKLKNREKNFPDLVIAGISEAEWYKSDEYKIAAGKNLLDSIHVVGVLEKYILYGIIENALTLCYPSLYEGFGFPPLEAMSLKVPVLAGNNSSIPEVTGNAAYLVNVLSVEDMARGLHKIVFDNSCRENLIEKGLNQVNKFSWSKAAGKYVQLYKEALG